MTDGLFKFNNLMDITPVYHHNLVRNLHCYITTPTSSTFSIYLGSICIQSIVGDYVCDWLWNYIGFRPRLSDSLIDKITTLS